MASTPFGVTLAWHVPDCQGDALDHYELRGRRLDNDLVPTKGPPGQYEVTQVHPSFQTRQWPCHRTPPPHLFQISASSLSLTSIDARSKRVISRNPVWFDYHHAIREPVLTEWDVWGEEIAPEKTSVTLTSLRPATLYGFAMRAVNGHGASPWSSDDQMTTLFTPGTCHTCALRGFNRGVRTHETATGVDTDAISHMPRTSCWIGLD